MVRIDFFDVVKGIGILLVVIGHMGTPAGALIYGCHIPLFFIISGWFFSDKALNNPIGFVQKRVKRLLLPMLCLTVPFYFIVPHPPVSFIKGILGIVSYPHNLLGTLWFLLHLFVVSILCLLLLKCISKIDKVSRNLIWVLLFVWITAFLLSMLIGTNISCFVFQLFFFLLGYAINKEYKDVFFNHLTKSLRGGG